MTLHRVGILIRLMSFLLLASPATAADWAQFRGPNRDGISQETGLLKEWPNAGPKLLWQIQDLGSGYSTPSRRSIAWLSDSLSTLRNADYSNTTLDSLPVAGQALLDGLSTRMVPLKGFRVVVYISSSSPKLLGAMGVSSDFQWSSFHP